MNTRRHFLRRLATASAGLAFLAGTAAHAKGPAKAQVRFTREVRARTRKLRVQSGRWRWLVAHHSGTRFGNASTYDREHRQRGMENGLAYHFVIGNGVNSGDGQIEVGGRWLKQLRGGHVHREEINESAIGICLVGNLDEEQPTRNQVVAFRELVDYLRKEVVGSGIRFAVHREIDPAHTACPGRHFPVATMHRLYGKFGRQV
jgi:hypothetical protein